MLTMQNVGEKQYEILAPLTISVVKTQQFGWQEQKNKEKKKERKRTVTRLQVTE